MNPPPHKRVNLDNSNVEPPAKATSHHVHSNPLDDSILSKRMGKCTSSQGSLACSAWIVPCNTLHLKGQPTAPWSDSLFLLLLSLCVTGIYNLPVNNITEPAQDTRLIQSSAYSLVKSWQLKTVIQNHSFYINLNMSYFVGNSMSFQALHGCRQRPIYWWNSFANIRIEGNLLSMHIARG